MKWIAVLFFAAIVAAFYLMGDRPPTEQTTEEQPVVYQEDNYDEFEEDEGEDPSWQNRRAEKIMPLGSNIQ